MYSKSNNEVVKNILLDGIIIGSSKMEHLKSNLQSLEEGPLNQGVFLRNL